jgi:dolichol-phosphate mannosyltransferase
LAGFFFPRAGRRLATGWNCVDTQRILDAATEPSRKTVDVSVIVPTYREAENLPILVPRVARALAEAGLDGEILIVDDNSPDETRRVCAELADRYPLRLVVRTTNRGLSPAVVAGMQQAAGDILLVMDADLSHPPEKIPELIETLRSEQTDFVIGSRYVPGGGTDDEWGWFRWLNSQAATLMAWPLTSARDPMAGFFALRAQTFRNAAKLDPIGYKIGLELLVKGGCRHVREVPIQFRDRLHGESKLSFKEQLNYLRHLRRLYVYKLGHAGRLFQFVLVGSTGMVVDLLVYALALSILPLQAARGLAIWLAMSWNFLLNRRLTYSDADRKPIWGQYVLFCLSCSLGAIVNWGVSVGLTEMIPLFDRWKLLAAMVGVLTGTIFNYVLSCRVAFGTPLK